MIFITKNNRSSAVILEPEEYARLTEIEENYVLMLAASNRRIANKGQSAIPVADVMQHLGIDDTDLEEIEAPKIE